MFAPRAFCSARRSAALVSGLGPPAFTAIAMSLLMRVKTFAIRFHRANIVALRVSKMRPMSSPAVCAIPLLPRRFIAPSRLRAPASRPAGSHPVRAEEGVHAALHGLADPLVRRANEHPELRAEH